MWNFTDSDWCETKMIGRVQVAMFFSYETLPYHGVKKKKQSVVALSSYEAEYHAASPGACQAAWLLTLLEHMHLKMEPMKLAVDKILALNQVKNSEEQGRSKHRDKIGLLERPSE